MANKIPINSSDEIIDSITEFNYDINNMEFIKFFQDSTGIILIDDLTTYNCENELKGFQLKIKKRLQDVWNSWI